MSRWVDLNVVTDQSPQKCVDRRVNRDIFFENLKDEEAFYVQKSEIWLQ